MARVCGDAAVAAARDSTTKRRNLTYARGIQLSYHRVLAASEWSAADVERAWAEPSGESKIVEIRSYNLKPGTRDRFHQLFLKEALPMLKRWKVDVVA